MSTAFRNFIITFALAAVLFGVVSYIAVTGVLNGLFSENGDVSQEESDYSYENAESYYDGEYGDDESGDVIPSSKDCGDTYVIFYEDHLKELCGAKLLCVNEESGKVVYDNIPLNSTLVVNGFNRTISEVYISNGEKYICGKLQYILGVDIKGYFVMDTDSMTKFFTTTEICNEYKIKIGCSLPYEVKYEDPEMKEYNEQNPDDIQYIKLIGDVTITAENAESIFNNVPEDKYDSKAATQMFGQIYDKVLQTLFSDEKIRNSKASAKAFFDCMNKCSIEDEEYPNVFSMYDGLHEVTTFPQLSGSVGKELNWSTLPSALEALLK